MKATFGAATALASLYASNPNLVEVSFQDLTAPSLEKLDQALLSHYPPLEVSSSKNAELISKDCHEVVAKACIRRMIYSQMKKYENIASHDEIEDALKYHILPATLQEELFQRYGGTKRPETWWESLQRLHEIAKGDIQKLWELVLDHPMTAYVPMQCPNCGNILPDKMVVSLDDDDDAVGLQELDPKEAAEDYLKLRGGWFRGRPRGPVVLQWKCSNCETTSRWYRSGHPQVILNPNGWGRLCGEQEDLRLALASYLGVQVRTVLPVDWDHIWSEYRGTTTSGIVGEWSVKDDSARNFAVRLEEGIGCWTLVLAIHPSPDLCEDVTEAYLRTVADHTTVEKDSTTIRSGRADLCHADAMLRYKGIVRHARTDKTGKCTQSKTLIGFVICERAEFPSERITSEMRLAAEDYRAGKEWWDVGFGRP